MDEIVILVLAMRSAGTDIWIVGPQSEAALSELENGLGIAMSASYRGFLAIFGGLGIGDAYISGLIDNQPLSLDAGSMFGDTMRFRENFGNPDHLLVIQPDEDAPYCIDTRSPGMDGEYPIVCYELYSRHTKRMSPSFSEWLLAWLRLRAK